MDKRISKILIFLVLAVGALGFCPGLLPFRLGEEIAAQCAIIIGIAIFFITNKWLRLFLIWNVIRLLMGINPLSIYALYVTAIYFVGYQLLVDKVKIKDIGFMLNVICGITLIQVCMQLLQFFGIWFIIVPVGAQNGEWTQYFKNTYYTLYITHHPELYRYTLTGFTSNVNMAAGLLAMALPAFFRRKWAWYIPLVLIGLYFTKTMGGIIPAAIVASVYIWIKKSKFRIPLIGVILFIVEWYVLSSESMKQLMAGSGRWEVWEFCIKKLIPLKWITGWGLNHSQTLWPIICKETSFKGVAWTHSHNEYITLWLEYGAIGFGLIMMYLFSILKSAGRNLMLDRNKFIILLGVIAFLLNCIVSFPAHVTIGIMGIIWLALLEASNKGEVK